MQRKILFTDLDGTLLNDEKQVSPALLQVLKQLQQLGHILVLSSGRPLDSIIEVKETLGLENQNLFISAYNGGLVIDCMTEKPLIEKRVSMEDVSHILEIAESSHTYCHSYTATHIVTAREGEELARYRTHIHLPYICNPDILSVLTEAPFKLLAIDLNDHAHLEVFREALYPWADGRIATLFSNPNYLELFPITSGKGFALKELCEKLDIPLANSMAAGDMDNDISMIEAAGYGIAMQNATSHIKEIADRITKKDNNHDGLLPFIQDFFMG
ncbi:MAG: Cof-type HAD-IIB family hydrolase [Lachnospiraceae bacterium]|nr:Cof-type HAD-IIB family hydrolase [Lachnospiraceae bacterium]